MTEQDIVERLTDAQKEWILSMQANLDAQPWDYDTVFNVATCIEIEPERRCEESGCLLVPAHLLWLGASGCTCDGVTAWKTLTPLGLSVRTLLEKQNAISS